MRLKAEEWHGYEQRFPAMRDKKIFLSLDEYAYLCGDDLDLTKGVNLKQSLAYAMLLNEMLRHTDLLTMAAQTTGVSLLDFNDTSAILNTLGLVYKMYSNHFVDAVPVELTGSSPQPKSKYAPGGADEPQTPSGSPTYPLDMVAALSSDHKYLLLSVVNATESEQKFNLTAPSVRLKGASTLWQLKGNSLTAANHVGEQLQAEIRESSLPGVPESISVSPDSVSIFQFPLAETGN
jgi:alpha-L-arabinofuranosidase